MNGLGTGQGKKADALVSFSTEAGETVELKGNLSLSPLGSEGTIAFAKVVLKKYAPYYSDAVRFDLDSGTLDARSGYSFAEGEGGTEFRLSGLGASVSDLRLRQREEKEEFLVIPEFSLKEAEVDIVKKKITIGGIATARGSVAVRRSAGGETNVARLVPDEGQSGEPAAAKGARMKSGGKSPAETAVGDHHQGNGHRPVHREVRGSHDGSSGGDRPRPAPAEGGEHRHRRKTAREILLRHPL